MFSRAVRNNRRAAQIFSVEGQTALSAPAHAYFVFRVPETAVYAESVPIIWNARDQLEPVILRPYAEQILADGEPVPGGGTGEPAVLRLSRLCGILSCHHLGIYVRLHLVQLLVFDIGRAYLSPMLPGVCSAAGEHLGDYHPRVVVAEYACVLLVAGRVA